MKKTLMLLAAVFALVSCSKEIVAEDDEAGLSSAASGKDANSKLVVRVTRADANQGTISYPVNVYVFDNTGHCAATHTFEEGSKQKTINLVEGQYDIYAIAGADAAHYTLPAQAEATKQSVVKLVSGQQHQDLMLSRNTVSLVDGEQNELSLALKRQVMLIERVQINNVPSAATKVEVVLAPLYGDLRIDGGYDSGSSNGTFALTKLEGQRTWETNTPVYLLPANGQPTITIRFTLADGSISSYAYTCADGVFVANKKFRIAGTYTEAVGVDLACTISGDEWAGTEDITFSFDKSGAVGGTTSPSTPNTPGTGNAPAEGTAYMGCYVLHSEVVNGQTVVTLIGAKQTRFDKLWVYNFNTDQTNLKNKIDELTPALENAQELKTGWRLPTFEELNYISAKGQSAINTDINSINANAAQQIEKVNVSMHYLYQDDTTQNVYEATVTNNPAFKYLGVSTSTNTMLRLFQTFTFP